jgi:hypothetical protein
LALSGFVKNIRFFQNSGKIRPLWARRGYWHAHGFFPAGNRAKQARFLVARTWKGRIGKRPSMKRENETEAFGRDGMGGDPKYLKGLIANVVRFSSRCHSEEAAYFAAN